MERMNVVIVGHVDHGKSTFTGRLLADTGSLPDGKLDQVKAWCAVNARPFEYAFLLDALKDEQAQGVTIDAARCFFKSEKRHYIIIDAPGHIEFLKNMITGASRAEAAILLIDAHEGVQENSRRHGYMLSMLGIKQVVVLINKMDLVGYSHTTFDEVKAEYTTFLNSVGVRPAAWIPVCARDGDHLVSHSDNMPWYQGLTVLEAMDSFHKEQPTQSLPFRLPVQDIYKFTAKNDDRRIVAGTVVSGNISEGTDVIFYPSGKRSTIKTIEGFNTQHISNATVDNATGFTLRTQIFIKPGELMCDASSLPPHVGTRFKASIFWLGKQPLVTQKTYKLKIGSNRVNVTVNEIIKVINAAQLDSQTKHNVDRHEVAEVIFQTTKPIAFDVATEHPITSRFVIVDNYDIAGGGIIIENMSSVHHGSDAQYMVATSSIDPARRAIKMGHTPLLVTMSGHGAYSAARALEELLFERDIMAYFVGANTIADLDSALAMARHLIHAGLVVILATQSTELDRDEVEAMCHTTVHVLDAATSVHTHATAIESLIR